MATTNFAGFRQHGYHNQPFGPADAFSPSMTGQNNTSFCEVLDILPNSNTVYSGIHTTGFLGHGNPTQPSPYPDYDFGGVSGGYSQLLPAENYSHATGLWNIDPTLLNMGQAGELFEEQLSMSLTDHTSPSQPLPSSPSDEAISPYSTSGESSEDEFTAPQPQVSAKSPSPSEIHPCPFCKSFKGDARALSTPRDLERHQMSAHQKITLICHICGAPTKGGRSDNLQRHIKKCHPEIFQAQ
ncbi:hypothetical protein CPLU01_14995 [Colletotrichum plurivorum]|uniref:C2H2-type domain-containing protein n=1 Tax=Colletotrichum plurivorum TaxID=2175906 RepID=A0A8H6JFL0_9PEZI|nr:hypothetical protein CPLU01_14995 [Colletotrichum plurivorum]